MEQKIDGKKASETIFCQESRPDVFSPYWDPPRAGGSSEDFSPYQGQGTIQGDPPDPTQPAGTGDASKRVSTLPLEEIEAAIKNQFPNPPGNIRPISIDESGNVGNFVSEYMAYHVSWYRDYSLNVRYPNDPSKQCLFAGHTHVGVHVSVADAEAAVEIQLDKLIEILP